ncbi:MAG: hypothetical protein IPK26_00430 [Planctomycetes bacterium]|nr:hypothetical protein [Planctomycetota bacterium]
MSRRRLLVPLLLIASLTAQTKVPDPGLIERTIARLSVADARTADDAMIALIRGDRASVPLLRAVLARKPGAAATERAQRALRICEIDAPIENGVKTGLVADHEKLRPGNPLQLTSTICNVTDAPIALFLGMSYSGNVLQNGLALAQQVPLETEGTRDGLVHARLGNVGFCGTGACPIVVVVKPWTAVEFVLPLEYRTEPKPQDHCPHDGPHLAAPWVFLPLAPEKRRVRLQLDHQVVASSAQGMVEPEAKANWNGRLRSNVIVIELSDQPVR